MNNIDLQIFSPIHQLNNQLFDDMGLKVFLKRDDLIHPLISGNKWRKLKYPLLKAREQHKSHLVTFGGAYSNHLLATAAAAAKFGFKSTAFVRGEHVDNDTLFMCRLHGMELIFTNRESYRNKEALFNKFFVNDADAFFIDEGGASPEGTLGCSELVNELPETYDDDFCACGTGTTAAGIINGLQIHNMASRFHAIPVFKDGSFIAAEIRKYLDDAEYPFELHPDYHFGGYAKTTPQLINFIKQFVADNGIVIDPVYTGKMLYSIYDKAAHNKFKPGSKILAIHTGGIWGLLGMRNKF